MPDPKDPLDPKEATEAKLCAYLEGELPPSERAEIEQHLAANPQHRQLLADLARTREWMRAVPAESSPVDLAEIFQGQVERSMLLNESSAGRSNWMARWPQFAMVAAILLLVAGLSALVVTMLKGPKTPQEKSFSLGATATLNNPATAPVVDQVPLTDHDKAPMAKALDEPVVTSTAPTAAAPMMPAVAGVLGGSEMPRAIENKSGLEHSIADATLPREESDASISDAVKSRLTQAGCKLPVDQETVCFVVSADSPATSIEQVRGFFARHQLAYNDADAAQSNAGSSLADKTGPAPLKFPPGAAATEPAFANSVAMASARNAAPQQSQGGMQNFNNSVQAQQFNILKQATAAPTTAPSEGALYISYTATPLQVELLSASLATNNLNQSVRRLTLFEPTVVEKEAIVPAGAVNKGQTLTVTVAQLVGPGIDKTNLVKVADDGTISLPMIDPLPAAGVTYADLQRRIADKYREANLIPQATVTVTGAAVPTTQTGKLADTQPTTLPAASQPVVTTTQPATPPSDVAVVVLIEKSKTPSLPR